MIMIALKASATFIMAGILLGFLRRYPEAIFGLKGSKVRLLKLILKLPNGVMNLRGIVFLISSCGIFLSDDISILLYLIMFQILLRWSCYAPKASRNKIKSGLRFQMNHR